VAVHHSAYDVCSSTPTGVYCAHNVCAYHPLVYTVHIVVCSSIVLMLCALPPPLVVVVCGSTHSAYDVC